jgi:hypothetical protein
MNKEFKFDENYLVINFYNFEVETLKGRIINFIVKALSVRHDIGLDLGRDFLMSKNNKCEEIIEFLKEFDINVSYWDWSTSNGSARGIKIKKDESLTKFILKFCP